MFRECVGGEGVLLQKLVSLAPLTHIIEQEMFILKNLNTTNYTT